MGTVAIVLLDINERRPAISKYIIDHYKHNGFHGSINTISSKYKGATSLTQTDKIQLLRLFYVQARQLPIYFFFEVHFFLKSSHHMPLFKLLVDVASEV